MTREDKIEQLENLKCHCYDMARVENSSNEWMKDIEALDFAIATLKQQPSDDCVSRQAVIEYIKDCDAELMHDIENESVREDILDMPPVTPKQEPKTEWIPTSEKTPEDRNLVLVTAYWHETYQVMMASYYGDGLWWCVPFNNTGDHEQKLKPIAWAELPKPYKESEE